MRLPRRRGGPPTNHVRLGDEDLMACAVEGDATAFATIYDRHGGVAYALAYRMCGRAQAAEDVVQEAFLSAWRRGSSYDPTRGSVRTWLLGIVHHRAIDALRRSGSDVRRRVDRPVEEMELDANISVDADVMERDRAGIVRAAMEDLPGEQRKVIELGYFGGFTHVEIADMLGVPVGTVKGRMRLGLSKLRMHFEPVTEVLS